MKIPAINKDLFNKVCLILMHVVMFSLAEKPEESKGHLRPFGESGPNIHVESMEGFPDFDTFWRNYVKMSKPLVMKGAAKLSPAFEKWTDEYIRHKALSSENNVEVLCEHLKKENRSGSYSEMTMDQFLDIYNTTEHYIVSSLPEYLYDDVIVPCPIQCQQYPVEMLDIMMWFSSGGTSSVIHTDELANINCLYRGQKKIIFLGHYKHNNNKNKTPLDKKNGASNLDVDRIDLDENPLLAGAEFLVANMEAGDCLYIPYLWVHQVRSFGSNLAVNFWWDFPESLKVYDKGKCPNIKCDSTLTLEKSMKSDRVSRITEDSMQDTKEEL